MRSEYSEISPNSMLVVSEMTTATCIFGGDVANARASAGAPFRHKVITWLVQLPLLFYAVHGAFLFFRQTEPSP